jgi:hypothetical protein
MKNSSLKTWVVDRFENGQAILTSGNERISVARAQLFGEVKEGDVVTAEFYLLSDEKPRRENLARSLLEEIFKKE